MKKIVPYILFLVAAVVAGFYAYKSQQLDQKLKVLQETASTTISSDHQDQLQQADSLLISGNYESALQVYDRLPDAAGLDTELRKQMTTQLLKMKENRVGRKSSDNVIDKDTSAIAETYETPDVIKFDSLSFALDKAQMQLKSIKKQMMEKAFGEYITFKSTKGNRLHYVGEVKNKMANGLGIAILDSGSRYEGDWKNNMRHGQGTFYWIDGEHYEGSYKNDQRSGKGTYFWTNGEKYVGDWEDDQRNGRGIFYGKNGKVITSGIWKDDKLSVEDAVN
jgi:uncharacterized protein YxeA